MVGEKILAVDSPPKIKREKKKQSFFIFSIFVRSEKVVIFSL